MTTGDALTLWASGGDYPCVVFIMSRDEPWRGVALCIGNGNYETHARLPECASDAADVGAELVSAGFDVDVLLDATRTDLLAAIDRFAGRLGEGVTAVFFYSGHSTRLEEDNYLLPVEGVEREADIAARCVPLAMVLQTCVRARCRLSFVALDSCRAGLNVSASGSPLTKGLAPVLAPAECLVAYACAPYTVYPDAASTERNSLFTRCLLPHIATAKLDVDILVRRASAVAARESRSAVQPWRATGVTIEDAFLLFKHATKTANWDAEAAGGRVRNYRVRRRIHTLLRLLLHVAVWNALDGLSVDDTPLAGVSEASDCWRTAAHYLKEVGALPSTLLRGLTALNLGGRANSAARRAAVVALLPRLISLTNLCIGLNEKSVAAIAAALQHLPQLERLCVTESWIGEDGVAALAGILPRLSRLKRLEISFTDGIAGGMRAVAAALPSLHCLEQLYLQGSSYNRMTDTDLGYLAAVLPSLPRLRVLWLSARNIGTAPELGGSDAGASALSTALSHASELEELMLQFNLGDSWNPQLVGGCGLGELAASLPRLRRLTTLRVEVHGKPVVAVSPGDAWCAFVAALASPPLLKSVDLQHTCLGAAGGAALLAALPHMQSLRELGLHDCHLEAAQYRDATTAIEQLRAGKPVTLAVVATSAAGAPVPRPVHLPAQATGPPVAVAAPPAASVRVAAVPAAAIRGIPSKAAVHASAAIATGPAADLRHVGRGPLAGRVQGAGPAAAAEHRAPPLPLAPPRLNASYTRPASALGLPIAAGLTGTGSSVRAAHTGSPHERLAAGIPSVSARLPAGSVSRQKPPP